MKLELELVEGEAQGLEESERELARLEAERDRLPAAMAAAAGDADAGRLQSLRRRAGELADEIFASRTRVLRLRLREAEERQSTLQVELCGLGDELTRVTVEAQKLQDAANRALEKRGAVMLRVMAVEASAENNREEVNELRAEIGGLVARASGQESGERAQQYGRNGMKSFGFGRDAA